MKRPVTDVDVLIVGSGHNALIGANYLTNSGLSVAVFEADTVPGGAVSTVERFPGYRIDRGSSLHLMFRHTGIAEELDLATYGLQYRDADPWAFAPARPDQPDAPGIVFHQDLDATAASIAAACGPTDAAAYRRFVADWTPLATAMMSAFSAPATPARLGLAFRPVRSPGIEKANAGLARAYLGSGDALLDEYFDCERLKAALAWFGAQSGPAMSEPGTAPMIGFAALMHSVVPGRAIGGSGALTSALMARLTASGASVDLGTPVTELRREGRGWRATVTGPQGPRSVRSRAVLAGCHVLTTLDLLERGGYDSGLIARWRRRIQVGPGVGMVLRLGTTAPPRFAGVDAEHQVGLGLLCADRADLARARGDMLAGDPPRRPAVLSMSLSELDSSVAPPGEHHTSLWAQWYPYAVRGGTDAHAAWAAIADREADRIVLETSRWAPGFDASIRHRHVQTPALLASELGLIGANVMHVEMALHNMLLFRPVPELAAGRVPDARGLLLTGASTHPGGGVNGAGGRTAARLLARELRGLARWRL